MGSVKDLLNNTNVLLGNIMDYKGDTNNLKSILHPINNQRIAEAITLSIKKFSCKCVVTNETTPTIKWYDIVAGQRIIQHDFKKSPTIHEIPT
jgi:hypothetical protein